MWNMKGCSSSLNLVDSHEERPGVLFARFCGSLFTLREVSDQD